MYVAIPALMAVVPRSQKWSAGGTAAPAATAAQVPVAPALTVVAASTQEHIVPASAAIVSPAPGVEHITQSREGCSTCVSGEVHLTSPCTDRRTCVAGEVRCTCSFKRVHRTGACRVGVAIAPVPAVSYVVLLQLCARRRRHWRSALRQSQP